MYVINIKYKQINFTLFYEYNSELLISNNAQKNCIQYVFHLSLPEKTTVGHEDVSHWTRITYQDRRNLERVPCRKTKQYMLCDI